MRLKRIAIKSLRLRMTQLVRSTWKFLRLQFLRRIRGTGEELQEVQFNRFLSLCLSKIILRPRRSWSTRSIASPFFPAPEKHSLAIFFFAPPIELSIQESLAAVSISAKILAGVLFQRGSELRRAPWCGRGTETHDSRCRGVTGCTTSAPAAPPSPPPPPSPIRSVS
jgi:hypothetical protein